MEALQPTGGAKPILTVTVNPALEGATGVPIDAVAIVAVVLLKAVLGFVQENKAENGVAALQFDHSCNLFGVARR
jgi:magnesium-transporting ATPase (P-type)